MFNFFPKKISQKKVFQKNQIVNLNISSPLLQQAVLAEGKLLYEKNKLLKFFFQMQVVRDYQDYLHLSGIQRSFLKAKLANL